MRPRIVAPKVEDIQGFAPEATGSESVAGRVSDVACAILEGLHGESSRLIMIRLRAAHHCVGASKNVRRSVAESRDGRHSYFEPGGPGLSSTHAGVKDRAR